MKPLAKSLSDEQMKFWVANTSLTEEQIQQWYVEFQEHSQKNQKLDQENFIKFFEKLKHKSKSTKTSTEVFKILFKGNIISPKNLISCNDLISYALYVAFDSDNSGYVDFQEFLVAFNIIGDGEIEKRLEWMFKIYDVNNDGSIDRKEIETILRVRIRSY